MTTLGTITNNVLRNLGDINKTYFTVSEIQQYIGEGYRKFYMEMVKVGGGYFETTTNLPFVANTETIDLSALTPTFKKISCLLFPSSTKIWQLPRAQVINCLQVFKAN